MKDKGPELDRRDGKVLKRNCPGRKRGRRQRGHIGQRERAKGKVRETDREQEGDKGSRGVRPGAREQSAIFR